MPLEGVKPVDTGPSGLPRILDLMGDQGLVGIWLTSSCALESSVPSGAMNFRPLNSGGLCEAVTTSPPSYPFLLTANCTTGVGTTPSSTALAPVETTRPGIFVAGCCRGPFDIPESVMQASAAAARAAGVIG